MHDAYELAEKQIRKGAPQQQVQAMLVQMGLDEKMAESVVSDIVDMDSEFRAGGRAGTGHMTSGALWFIGGVLVTAISYSAASPGEMYLFAWGAILFGALQFLRGLSGYYGW